MTAEMLTASPIIFIRVGSNVLFKTPESDLKYSF